MTGRVLMGLTRSDLQTVRPETETVQMRVVYGLVHWMRNKGPQRRKTLTSRVVQVSQAIHVKPYPVNL